MSEVMYKAKLVRGNCYYLGNKRFDKNVVVLVTQAERDHLEETAVDTLNSGDELFDRQKFEFEEAGSDDAESGGKPTRARGRATS